MHSASVAATYSSDVVTLRERYPSNLQLELEGLQEKISKTVQSLLEENSSCCLEKRRLMVENWSAIRYHSQSLTYGFISFKKSLKKAIEVMKEESIKVDEMLMMQQLKVYSSSLHYTN